MLTQSRGSVAYDAVMGALRDGTFGPGDRLREEDVAERLSLSRTPVREALRRLEADGIVEHRPRIGAVIRRLDYTGVVELYEMRVVLERTAAELAAKHGLQAEFDTLDSLNDRMEAARATPALCVALNQDFHQALYYAGRNRFLLEAARAINNSLLLLGPSTYTDGARIDMVVQQHRAIVGALRDADIQAAGAAAEAHLQTSLRARLEGFARCG